MICDAQIHNWEPEDSARPWPTDRQAKPHRPVPLTGTEVLGEMDRVGVDRAVLVPPSWVGEQNEDACAEARAHPTRFAVMGRFNVEERCDPEVIRSWRQQDGMLGMRLTFHDPAHGELLRLRSLDWLWTLLEECSVPIMMFAPGSNTEIADVAGRFPGLRLILDHLTLTRDDRDEKLKAVVEKVLPLARFDNIAVKASALPCYVSEAYPFEMLQTQVRRVIDEYGANRVMWGSDVSRLTCPYGEWVDFFRNDLGFITAEERDWVLGNALIEWLRWDVRSPASQI
jgi:predicted TIM-barrel fold metal-dependent hydrolase